MALHGTVGVARGRRVEAEVLAEIRRGACPQVEAAGDQDLDRGSGRFVRAA